MIYAGVQDLVERYGEQEILQLTDRTHAGQIDATVAERALRDAAAEIDGYLAARYVLPLAIVPTVLLRLCAELARYYLYDDHAPEQVRHRYNAAVEFLTKISTGKVALGVSDAGESAQNADVAQMESGGRIWARDRSEGFI